MIDKIKGRSKTEALKRIFESFGDNWWQKIIPYQRTTTKLAWPTVNWNMEDSIPL